jgi:hypothetical protein
MEMERRDGSRPVAARVRRSPTAVVNQELDRLPPGVHLVPGRIVLDGFSTPDEAKQILLVLIMAMGNDPRGFDARITVAPRYSITNQFFHNGR